jgi:hypothetical protein
MKSFIVYLITLFLFSSHLSGQVGSKLQYQRIEATASYSHSILQGFNMKLWMNNELVFGKEIAGSSPNTTCADYWGLEYPAGSCVEHLYGAGPIIGGIINGVRRVSAAYYAAHGDKDFQQSFYDSGKGNLFVSSKNDTTYNPLRYGYYKSAMNKLGVDDDSDGTIDEDILDGMDNDGDWDELTDDLGSDGLPDTLEIGCRGKFDPNYNPDPANDNWDSTNYDVCKTLNGLTPFKKINRYVYTQGNLLPDHGERHVDEDFASISDNDISFYSTDTVRLNTWHHPLGIKIHQRSFAWRDKMLDGILPIEYTLTNISDNVIRDVYLGINCDFDVGLLNSGNFAIRNYSGYYPKLRTAYMHNPVDNYSTPSGVALLSSSKPFEDLRIVYRWYASEPDDCGQSPDYEEDLYNCMRCDTNETRCISHDQSSLALDDSRLLLTFGPFEEFKQDDTLRFSLAFVAGNDLLEHENSLSGKAKKALIFHHNGYKFPTPPPSPMLHILKEEKKVTLTWENIPFSTAPDDKGNKFEGYRVYRIESDTFDIAKAVLLAQYDVDDDYRIGSQTGIKNSFVDSFIRKGNTYWYAVTSYSVFGNYIHWNGQSYDTLFTDGAESPISENVQKVFMSFGHSSQLGEVLVVPNPYIGSEYYVNGNGFEGLERDWTPYKRMVRFIHLPAQAHIRIYTIAGEVVATFRHDESAGDIPGQHDFHLFTESGRQLANGIYVYTVESEYGKQIGKFVIAR